VIALVLAGVALPLILDSGVKLPSIPSIGLGHGPHSSSASGPVEKVVVPPPATKRKPAPHRTAAPAKPVRPTPAPRPQSQPQRSSGGTSRLGGHTPTRQISRPTHTAPAHNKQPAPRPDRSGGTSSHAPKPKAKPAPPPPAPPTTTTAAAPPPPPPTTTLATTPAIAAPPTTTSPAKAKGASGNKGSHAQPQASRQTLALTPKTKHIPPGQADKQKGPPPRGRALGHRDHVPPGLAKKEPPGVPPGHASDKAHGHGNGSGQSGAQDDEQGNGHGWGGGQDEGHGRGNGHGHGH
jgi:hypothetical protein